MSPLASLWTSWFINSFNPIIGSFAVKYTQAFVYVALSCAVAVLWYTPHLNKVKGWKVLFDKKYILSVFMIGTFGTAIPFSLLMYSLNFTSPSNMAILNQTEIIYSLIFSYLILGEKPSFQQLCGTALVVFGVGIILFHDSFSIKWKGDLIVIGAVWMFQISHAYAKKLPKAFDNKMIPAARALFALPALLIVILGLALNGGVKFEGSLTLAGCVFFNAILVYGTGNVLWYNAIRNMDLSKASAIMLSYPCMTFLISISLGIEKGHLYQVAGLACAMGGAFWVTRLVKKQAAKKELAMACAGE